MKGHVLTAALAAALLFAPAGAGARSAWTAPVSPVIDDASGFVVIPGVAMAPSPTRIYRAVYNATRAAEKPDQLVPALDMAGSELNGLGAMHIPLTHARFVIVFHDDAINGILTDLEYRKKFGVTNPNLKALAQLRHAGVRLYVCGQNLAFAHIDPATLSPDVKVASDALIVLMACENDGYALLDY